MTAKQLSRVLILVLATSVTVSIAMAILSSPRLQQGAPVSIGNPAASDVGAAPQSSTRAVPTSNRSVVTARASTKGYAATVRIVPTEGGASVLEVDLSTESTPASAPSAQAELRGPGAPRRTIELTLIGAGRWESSPQRLVAGTYLLTIRFDRSAGRLVIPVPIRLP